MHHLVRTTIPVVAFILVAARANGGATQLKSAVYTDDQAMSGRQVYYRNCANCHGENLEGKVGPPLIGRQFHQMVASQDMNAPLLLKFISTQMPQSKPGSLTSSEDAAVLAFILEENGYPSGNSALTADSPDLKDVNLAAAPKGG